MPLLAFIFSFVFALHLYYLWIGTILSSATHIVLTICGNDLHGLKD